jgi:putative ABC transport system permease protein
MPDPLRPLAWLLRLVLSPPAADAAIGDLLEEVASARASGRSRHRPWLWLNVQIVRLIGLALAAHLPRLVRAGRLAVRDATRAVRAAPAHSLSIVAVLALGVTAGTVTFSVVDAVLLKPLPIEQPQRLVTLTRMSGERSHQFTPEQYWQLHDHLQSVDGLATLMTAHGSSVTVGSLTDEWPVASTSADIFQVLRWSPAIGRFWTAEDEARGETEVAVLGYRFWQQHFQGSAAVLGETVTVGKRSYEVIGVLPAVSDRPEFDLTSTPIWVPNVVPRTASAGWFGMIIARLQPGVSPGQLENEIQRLTGASDWRPVVAPLLDLYVTPVRAWMLLALGAAALVVLIGCVNAANLMLTRSVARAQEMAVRAAIGASRAQIAAGVLAEGLVLSLAATAGALVCSVAGVQVAKATITTMLPGIFRSTAIELNGRVFAAAVLAAAVTGVLVSIVPAWQTSRAPVSALLRTEAGTAIGRGGWRSAFLVAEVATVVVLVMVSWLFVASLIRAVNIDLGIDRTNLLAVMPSRSFQGTVDEVQRRLEGLPGVTGVAVSTGASLPLIGRAYHGVWGTRTIERAGEVAAAQPPLTVLDYRVSANYFDVAGLTFRRGSTWTADMVSGSPPIVLDQQAARHLFGHEDPIGRLVRATKPDGVFTVVGTVPHVRVFGPEDEVEPAAYFAVAPNPARTLAGLFVKTSRPPAEMLPVINEALKPLAPATHDPFVFVADEAVWKITAQRRFNAGLMSAFGLIGLLIGIAGVYAVMASFVAQQTREIGIRVALGATPGRIQRDVMGLAWRHLLAGLALGLPIAWWLSRGFEALLFQVSGADATAYAVVVTLFSMAGCLAAWIPARRAARVDPITSLRS